MGANIPSIYCANALISTKTNAAITVIFPEARLRREMGCPTVDVNVCNNYAVKSETLLIRIDWCVRARYLKVHI